MAPEALSKLFTGGFGEEFLETVCPFRVLGHMAIIFDILLLILLLVSFPYLEPGSANSVIAVVSLVIVLTVGVGIFGLLSLCRLPHINE